MGGKGRKRRQKNYRAAHGVDTRLPPPPDLGAVDAIPSKLRRLMQLMKGPPPKPEKSEVGKNSGNSREKGVTPGKRSDETKVDEDKNSADELTKASSHDKKKRKRKREAVKDLRFQALYQVGGGERKQKRKEYFKAKKKKQKKENKSETSEFPKHELISFGEVVEAPPKLTFPKGTVLDPSHERRRLRVIEAYRHHKGWESRPGIHLPAITEGLSP